MPVEAGTDEELDEFDMGDIDEMDEGKINEISPSKSTRHFDYKRVLPKLTGIKHPDTRRGPTKPDFSLKKMPSKVKKSKKPKKSKEELKQLFDDLDQNDFDCGDAEGTIDQSTNVNIESKQTKKITYVNERAALFKNYSCLPVDASMKSAICVNCFSII